MRPRSGCAAVCALLASSGCAYVVPTPLPDLARQRLVDTYTCPAGEVTVTPRPDIPGHVFFFKLDGRPEQPPAEVAADPARLELWKQKNQELIRKFDRHSVFDVRGCGHQLEVGCIRDVDFQPGQGLCLP